MAAPPAYTASSDGVPQYVPDVPPQYDSSAPAAGPQQNVQYVNQYGQPIQAPPSGDGIQQQPKVQYVNQFGQPIQAPVVQQQVQQPAVQYVNQYGQPISAPVQQQAQNVQYVNQFGQPIAAPVQTGTAQTVAVQPAPKSAGAPGSPEAKEKQQRTLAFVLGLLGGFLLFIGLCTDSLSTYNYYIIISYHCGWSSFYSSNGYSMSYSEINDEYPDTEPAATTQTAAILCCILMVTACLIAFVGAILVQPFCQAQRCCQTNSKKGSCPRSCYLTSSILCLLTVILWYGINAGDGYFYCTEDSSMGSSLVLCIVGMIIIGIAGAFAR